MNQEGFTQVGFSQATGRLGHCPACRKPLPRPELNQLVLVCGFCRTETSLTPPIMIVNDSVFRMDGSKTHSSTKITDVSKNSRSDSDRVLGTDYVDDDFELKLEPEAARVTPIPSLSTWQVAEPTSKPFIREKDAIDLPPDLAGVRSDRFSESAEIDSETRSEQARLSYNTSSGLYPRVRHYPTLEAMQRLYRLFGYAAVSIVFPYIAFRSLYLLLTTEDQYLQALAEFSEFAVPMMFGCVALTATLFAASEGIRLAMDIQDNTLRIANSSGRRKVN